MAEIKRPVNIHKYYHAHPYFNSQTLQFASKFCEKAGTLFDVRVGRVHQKPVGPHPEWSCQISFSDKDFDQFVPWLEQNRNGLTVFVHGVSGNGLKDHTDHAYWLGDSAQLNLAMFIAE